MSIADHAELLFVSNRDEELLGFAEANWTGAPSGLSAAHAELARYARIAAYRTQTPTREVWQARHVTAAAVSGNLRSLALSLQPLLFGLIADGHSEQAREVLDMMVALANASTVDAPPNRDLVDRITSERRAYTYAIEQRWEDASTWYDRARDLAPAGSRGRAKVEGGAAVARWLAGGATLAAAETFSALTEVEWPDVREWARINLAAAKGNDRAGAVPFDLV